MYSLGYVLGPLGLGLGLETWGRVIIKCPRTRVSQGQGLERLPGPHNLAQAGQVEGQEPGSTRNPGNARAPDCGVLTAHNIILFYLFFILFYLFLFICGPPYEWALKISGTPLSWTLSQRVSFAIFSFCCFSVNRDVLCLFFCLFYSFFVFSFPLSQVFGCRIRSRRFDFIVSSSGGPEPSLFLYFFVFIFCFFVPPLFLLCFMAPPWLYCLCLFFSLFLCQFSVAFCPYFLVLFLYCPASVVQLTEHTPCTDYIQGGWGLVQCFSFNYVLGLGLYTWVLG